MLALAEQTSTRLGPFGSHVLGTARAGSLWWISGSNGNVAGIPQLFLLLLIFAIPFFVLPFAVETLLRRHSPKPAGPEMT